MTTQAEYEQDVVPIIETSAAPRPKTPTRTKLLKVAVRAWLLWCCEKMNELSLWIQKRILHQTVQQKRCEDNLAIPIAEMDRDLLGMYIRWTGHNIEKRVRSRGAPKRGEVKASELRAAVEEWRRRGYPTREFILWADENLRDYERWRISGEPQFRSEAGFSPQGQRTSLELLTKRVSTRRWKPVLVSEEVIRELIRVATCAPTACNRQAWKLYVHRADELDGTANAPGVLNPTLRAVAPATIYIAIDKRLYPEDCAPSHDAGIIALQLSLAASALGLSGCLIYGCEAFNQEAWRKQYGIPDYRYMELMFLFGYPAEQTSANKRTHVDDVAIFVGSRFLV